MVNAEDKKINAISIVYLGMKEDRWIAQNELKAIVERAVGPASNVFMEGSSQQLRIWNEVATVFLVAIVMLATVKKALSFVWGLVGIIGFAIILMGAIKVYKKMRETPGP